MIVSGGPNPRDRLSQWMRAFRVPLALTGAFVVLLVAFAMTSQPQGSATGVQAPTDAPATPSERRCLACGIGERCDPDTGECMLAQRTTAPCNPGSHYDEKAGFCFPDPTPKATPLPAKTIDPNLIARTPQAPRTPEHQPPPVEETVPPSSAPPSQQPTPDPND